MRPHPAVALLDATIEHDPRRVAVRTVDGALTAADLGDRVRDSAVRWTRLGAVPGDVVLVVGARSVEQPITLLGAWVAGLIPVLVDDLPARRLERLAREAEARWVVHVATDERNEREVAARSVPADASHVLFTSGTTGGPAGVVVGPEAIEAALRWFVASLAPGPHDRVAMLGGLGHDPLLREILLPLLGHGELIVPSEAATRDPRELVAVLRDGAVTILNATPSLIEFGLGHVSGDIALPSLRMVLLGGEAPTARSVQLLRSTGSARILNVYGTTETPQVAAAADIGEGGSGYARVGTGVGGYQLLLGTQTSARFRELTQCGDDEIVVRAPHLARGYLVPSGRPRFVEDPLGEPGWRAYLTGDRGALGKNGDITVAGRIDREIGLHGHRIHPSEVEAAAVEIEGVNAARCRLVEDCELGPVLALCVLTDHETSLKPRTIRAGLRQLLPGWAVPSRIEIEDGADVLTANNKRAW